MQKTKIHSWRYDPFYCLTSKTQTRAKAETSNLILLVLIIVSSSICLSCTKQESKENKAKCLLNLYPNQFDSLHINFNYQSDEYSLSPFLSLSIEKKNNYLRGQIENIEETEFKLETRFDEEVEIPLKKTIYTFNDKNSILSKEISVEGNERIKYEYNNKDLLIREVVESPSQKQKTTTFKYDRRDLLIETKCTETFFEIHKMEYDSTNHIIQETLANYGQWNLDNDSVVVKYTYFQNRLNEIIFYNKEGQRINHSFVTQNENEIKITTQRQALLSGLNETIAIINLKLNNVCNLMSITQVYKWVRDENVYIKIELNDFGDIVSYDQYKIKVSPTEYLDFIDIDEYTDRSNMEFEKYVRYEYKYDNKNNWIERKDGNLITRRNIKYRIS